MEYECSVTELNYMLLPLISVFLMIISSFSWVAMNSNVLNYQSTAISQEMSQQFLLAENALTQAERWLQKNTLKQLPPPSNTCTRQPCIVTSQTAAYFPEQPASWWQDSSNLTVMPVMLNIPKAYNAFYTVEQLEDSNRQNYYFRITAWALLHSQSLPSVLQSVWTKSQHENQRYSWRQWK
jgi:Tfp pilus assembly protein PilX